MDIINKITDDISKIEKRVDEIKMDLQNKEVDTRLANLEAALDVLDDSDEVKY